MKNVGSKDSQVRLVLGLLFFTMAFFAGGAPHWLFMAVGVILVTTAFLKFCPIWFGFRINTHRTAKPK
jgi:hypothetical protein